MSKRVFMSKRKPEKHDVWVTELRVRKVTGRLMKILALIKKYEEVE